MISFRSILVIAALICLTAAEKKGRNPKLFFASISSSTTTSTVVSTLNTVTFCYTSDATITAACKRKKRSIIDDSLIGDEALPTPSRTKREPRNSKVMDLEPTSEAEVAKRDPRFFLLLTSTSTITATITTTSTAFTATNTLSLNCIPTVINACG